jgi:aminotransferase
VTIGSFSATYAMGGWRAGYVVGEPALLHPVTALKQALTICSPAPSQWAALAALEGPRDEPAAAVREVAARRAAALPALEALGLPHGAPQGGYYVFADVRATGLTGREFAAVALREGGVRVVPGDRFGAGGAGFVRLSLARPVPVLAEALGRLGRVVEGLKVEGRRSPAHGAVPEGVR